MFAEMLEVKTEFTPVVLGVPFLLGLACLACLVAVAVVLIVFAARKSSPRRPRPLDVGTSGPPDTRITR
jgi:hypothetical protein